MSRPVLSLLTVDTLSQVMGGGGEGPVYCQVSVLIPSLYPVAHALPTCESKNVSRHCQVSPGRQNHPS